MEITIGGILFLIAIIAGTKQFFKMSNEEDRANGDPTMLEEAFDAWKSSIKGIVDHSDE